MIITPEEESKDVGWWVKVIDVAISIPGIKVNREEFLKKELLCLPKKKWQK